MKNDDGQEIDPREQKLRDLTMKMAGLIDAHTGSMGFVIFLWDRSDAGFLSYASNGNRDDVRKALVEHLIRTETYEERMARTEKKR